MKRPRTQLTTLLVTLVMGVAGSAIAQENATARYYVARATGSWVTVKADGQTEPLATLDALSSTTRIAVSPSEHADSLYEIVLRNPRTLQTVRWQCKPVARCSSPHTVGDFNKDAGTLKTSARTGGLFLDLAQNPEDRARVKLLGARGSARDWGLFVLVEDAGTVDLSPLVPLANRKGGLIARMCLSGANTCNTSRRIGAGDCRLTAGSPCKFELAPASSGAVSIDVYAYTDTLIAPLPMAQAFGVLTPARSKERLAKEVDEYLHDMADLGTSVSPEERLALERAAARRLAQP